MTELERSNRNYLTSEVLPGVIGLASGGTAYAVMLKRDDYQSYRQSTVEIQGVEETISGLELAASATKDSSGEISAAIQKHRQELVALKADQPSPPFTSTEFMAYGMGSTVFGFVAAIMVVAGLKRLRENHHFKSQSNS